MKPQRRFNLLHILLSANCSSSTDQPRRSPGDRIIQYLHDFAVLEQHTKNRSDAWKFIENFSFYRNFQFSGSTTLYISCHNLGERWPRTKHFSSKYPSRIPLKVSSKHTYRNATSRLNIGEDIGGRNVPPPPVLTYVTLIKRAWHFQG